MPGIAVELSALRMTMRLIPAAIVVSSLATGALLGEVLSLPEGRVVGGVLRDDGTAMIAVADRWGKEHEATSVLFWDSAEATRTITVPSDRVRSVRFADGRFVLTNCVSLPQFGSHCAWGYQIFELNESGEAQLEWELDPGGDSTISNDGTAWVTMGGDESKRTFNLGRSSSPAIERTATVLFDYPEPHMPEMGLPPVFFLDVGRGIVLTPWSGGAYILTLGEGDVRSVPWLHHEPKATRWDERAREVAWAGLSFAYQEDESVLWAMKYDQDPEDPALWPETTAGRTWQAYDFRDLESPAELPNSPFWTVNVDAVTTSAWPHPHRGFVRVVSGPAAYRLVHDRPSPDSDKSVVRHLSDCQQSHPAEATFVSPNGRHAIVIEGELRRARRIGLRPAPSTDGSIPDCDLNRADSENPE